MWTNCSNDNPFLDLQSIWNSNKPQFDACLEKTIFLWIPCGLVLLFLPFYAITAKNSHHGRKIAWTKCWLCCCRRACLSIIFMASLVRCIAIFVIEMKYGYVDLVQVMSMAFMSVCMLILVLCSIRSSILQVLNIGAFCLFAIPELYSKIMFMNTVSQRGQHFNQYHILDLACFFVMYLGLWASFIAFSLGNYHNRSCKHSVIIQDFNAWPERHASFFSRLFFGYMWRMFFKGYQKIIQAEDIWNIDYTEGSEHISDQFMEQYEMIHNKRKLKPGVTLALTVLKIHWKSLFMSIVLITMRDIFAFITLLDLRWLIQMSADELEPKWHSYVYIGIYFISELCRQFCWEHHNHELSKIGIRLRSSIASCVMRKSLRLSPNSKREFGPGAISNLSSVDAGQFLENVKFINLLWSVPITLAFGMCVLYVCVGQACWIGLAVIGTGAVVNGICGRILNKTMAQEMVEKDKRMRLLAEVLRIIRVVKLYAWELAFKKFIDAIRMREIGIMQKFHYTHAVNSLTFGLLPPVAMISMFLMYTFGLSKLLTPQVAFPAIVVLSSSFAPLSFFPRAVSGAIAIVNSFKRLDKYFSSQELENYVEHSEEPGMAVSVTNGQFTWDQKDLFTLKNTTAEIGKGQLIAVIGTVGSGKSSLLNAMASEMYSKSGKTMIMGTMAYVPQNSWILNDTLKGNVLFNKPADEQFYDKVITACALKPDLEILPAGDMTEIGERGINLSGGQKHRVSLARAVYQDQDIYLLDDPLSAVDVHVQKQLFEKVIGSEGLLKDKTRIFVTNAILYLSMCDQVMVMDKGTIVEFGPFQAVAEKCSGLLKDIKQHIQGQTVSEQDNAGREAGSLIGNNVPASGKLVTKEAMNIGIVSWSTYWIYLKSAGCILFSADVLGKILLLAYSTIAFVYVQSWTDKVASAKNASDVDNANHQGVIFMMILTAIEICVAPFSVYFMHKSGVNAARRLHNDLLERMLMAPITLFECTPSGRFLNRFSQDINTIDNVIPLTGSYFVVQILYFMLRLPPIIFVTPMVLALFAPFGLALFILQKFYITTARQFQRLEAISRSPAFSQLHDVLQGLDSIRIYGVQQIFIAKFHNLLDKNAGAKMCLLTAVRWLTLHFNILTTITSTCSIILVLYTSVSPGYFGLAVTFIVLVSGASQVVQAACELETAFVAVERVKEYLNLPQEASWATPNAKSQPKVLYHLAPINLAEWPETGEIEFKNYSLRYRPDLPLALKGINLKIRDGEKVGIVGRTGAGKTSITAGLFRLVEPAEGHILIDSIDISTIGLHDLRKKLTIIPQDPSVFSGTIRQNLDPFKDYSDDKVWRALELSYLKPYVVSLPDGIDHQLDEGGCNLSMGQRQLLCLARALLWRSKILVLDEATASVDLETDKLIQQAIRNQFSDCTVITIAHRLETILDYDSVVVLSDGQIVEHGPIKDLLADPNSNFSLLSTGCNIER